MSEVITTRLKIIDHKSLQIKEKILENFCYLNCKFHWLFWIKDAEKGVHIQKNLTAHMIHYLS